MTGDTKESMRLHLIFDLRTGTLLHIFQDHIQFLNKKRDLELDGRLIRTESWDNSDTKPEKEKAPEPKSEGLGLVDRRYLEWYGKNPPS